MCFLMLMPSLLPAPSLLSSRASRLLCCALLCCALQRGALAAPSSEDPPPPSPAGGEGCLKEPKPAEERLWELSFGTTQLFEGWFGEDELDLPVSSATVMLSRDITGWLNAWVIFNLPLVSAQVITKDGELKTSRSAPALLLGLSADLFEARVSRRDSFKLELGLYAGQVLREGGRAFPLAALRGVVLKGGDTTLYIGVSGSALLESVGLIYGVGHRF